MKSLLEWCEAKEDKLFSKSVDGTKQSTGIQKLGQRCQVQWFKDWCDTHNGVVSIAHHLKDQAETAVFKLARGSDLDKISSMSVYSEKYRIWRPLLELDYSQINKLLHGEKFLIGKIRAMLQLNIVGIVYVIMFCQS